MAAITKRFALLLLRTKFLERTHGSALFTRGETQAIVVVTLGNDRDAQIMDDIIRREQRPLHAALQFSSLFCR